MHEHTHKSVNAIHIYSCVKIDKCLYMAIKMQYCIIGSSKSVGIPEGAGPIGVAANCITRSQSTLERTAKERGHTHMWLRTL